MFVERLYDHADHQVLRLTDSSVHLQTELVEKKIFFMVINNNIIIDKC